ncbi:tRNA glutamyl-Q(34) synthetase GluQRS [Psychromonas sp. B3M02]|uniref:tRNA glutamyl-Q(34) synthetase GluQRS n=1 Tax=unclassified Psychromonas TaxID=2614957 RepID=UPI000DEABD06|nr:tRNA glutamyl-Q(34) synthetase GluQRS [Psychromonas sp. B3M02]RBW45012.1 tRNA glutamyl-Q(34) synthetase GluQRS [Psychromonas sp. B3M02]
MDSQFSKPYIGRFAPSPSGPLHFGSLVAAVGSYLQAKSQQGQWQVRIEDIDPPREVAGASDDILATLLAFGLQWDGPVIYQHQQSAHYEAVLTSLIKQGLCYACCCTRKMIKEQGGLYLGHCRHLNNPLTNNALRINLLSITHKPNNFEDQLQGLIQLAPSEIEDDFIIKRKDGLYAYNLAVVIDDIKQGITEIVRGSDLITTTGKQLCLYQLLGANKPNYVHLPVAVTAPGQKLSKQNHAAAVDKSNPIPTLKKVLAFLGHTVPNNIPQQNCSDILTWAIQHWSLESVPKQREIQI